MQPAAARRARRAAPGTRAARALDDDAALPAVRDVSLHDPRRRDRRHRRRVRQRPARAGRGPGRPARRRERRDHRPRRALSRDARGEMRRRSRVAACRRSRCSNACVARMSVADNMAFRDFDRAPFAAGGWWLIRAAIPRKRACARSRATRSRRARTDTPIGDLSGGNVQRAVLARELGGEVDVLIAANPCFGLDFAAVAEIHARDHGGAQSRRRGAAGQRGSRRAAGARRPPRGDFPRPNRSRDAASDADLTDIGRHMAGH